MRPLRILRSDCARVAACFVALMLICTSIAIAAPAGSTPGRHALEFVTEEFPPLNFNNNGRADGFGSDIIREMLRRTKLDAPLTVLPWARAYMMARTQPNVGIYCVVRTAERENLFQWIGPIGNLEGRIYANRDSDLHINTIADAKSAKHVIVLREGYNAQMLEKLGFTNLTMVNDATEGLRLLLISGSRSVFLVSSTVIPDILRKTSTPADAIKPLFTVTKNQLYIGFSRDTSPEFIDFLQHTIDAMKADGSFAAIHQKWFSGDKMPGLKPDADLIPAN